MSYKVLILSRAESELSLLPKNEFLRVDSSILALKTNPRPPGCKKLKERTGWRIRSGSYRIVYEIDDGARTVTVIKIGHRSDVYR